MVHGVYEKKKMEHLKIPLNDQEEAILELMRQVNHLEHENFLLREENKQLKEGIEKKEKNKHDDYEIIEHIVKTEKVNINRGKFLIIDELTLINTDTIEKILNDEKYNDYFIFLLGDIDADGKVQLDFDTPALPGKAVKAVVAPAEEI